MTILFGDGKRSGVRGPSVDPIMPLRGLDEGLRLSRLKVSWSLGNTLLPSNLLLHDIWEKARGLHENVLNHERRGMPQ